MNYCYRAYGMIIRSDVSLPELEPAEGEPDVEISIGVVPEQLDNPVVSGVRYQASPGILLLKVDGIANYLIVDGKRIVVDASAGAADEEIRLFLLGSALGALLHQSGVLPLHAGAVDTGEGAVLFLGRSGLGKSTLVAALETRGYALMADDVAVVQFADGRPIVVPAYPQIKIWADTARKIGHNTSSLHRVRPQLEKYGLRLANGYCSAPQPLRKIYVLKTTNTLQFELRHLGGVDNINTIIAYTYRLPFVEGLGNLAKHFEMCTAISMSVPVAEVVRPRQPFMLDDLIELIESDLR